MNYQVLARKYRPANFVQLKGQESLVATLLHAIKENKIAHAFLLTGIRGVGKTTTARIIAKTINCTNLQIKELNIEACNECANCKAFINENHPDVIEVDAASKTGINDIREIIEGASYAPILAKYKIYIIDEVHMLSTSAFNALLKTLEEPPAHTKFIFATTEPKKIPLTIISRCQRFDLRRLTVDELVAHLKEVCTSEKIKFEEAALKLIALHSDGSVRDSLSLLDQVILHIKTDGKILVSQVQNLLGITSMILIYQVFDLIIKGEAEAAILFVNDLYHKGSEPLSIIEDLLTACNIVSKMHVIPNFLQSKDNAYLSDAESELVKNLAKKTDSRSMAILWQMLLKGFEEVSKSTNNIQALEMIIIRICCLADLPTPEEIIKGQSTNITTEPKIDTQISQAKPVVNGEAMVEFKKIAEIFLANKEMILYHQLKSDVALLDYAHGRIEVKVIGNLPKDFATQVTTKLNKFTEHKWQFIIASDKLVEGKTLASYEQSLLEEEKQALSRTDIVDNILKAFPGATIENIMKT